jgi:hypothetical protein
MAAKSAERSGAGESRFLAPEVRLSRSGARGSSKNIARRTFRSNWAGGRNAAKEDMVENEGRTLIRQLIGDGENGRKLVTMERATKELGVTRKHVYNLLKAGHLEAVDISVHGKRGAQSLRISLASIRSFLEARRIDPDCYFGPFEEME